jgi:hypothetical protein
MGIWQRVTSWISIASGGSRSTEPAQGHPNLKDVVPEVLHLRALPADQRILPTGLFGQAVAELLAGVERLSDVEVLWLHGVHSSMYLNPVLATPSGLSLARLTDIAADRRVDRRWRAGAVMELSRFGAESVSALPMLLQLLDEFPKGAYSSKDRDLLCATAVALGALGETAMPFLPKLLAIFEHPEVQADDRQSCPFGSVSTRSQLLGALVQCAPADERVIALCEQALLDVDVSLQLRAIRALARSGVAVERGRAKLTHALRELETQTAEWPVEFVSREDVCHELRQALSDLQPRA